MTSAGKDVTLTETTPQADTYRANGRTDSGKITSSRRSLIALAILCCALVVPIWMVEYVPLIDYPDHLSRAFILSHLDDPAYNFSDSYEADWGPYPYVALDLSFIAAMKLFSPEIAGKVVLCMILLLLPLCCAYFTHSTGGSSFHAFTWASMVSISGYFLLGFVTMHLSFAFAFLGLAIWSGLEKHPSTWTHWSGFFLAVSASYFAHLLGFALAGLSVTLYCLFARKPIRLLLLSWLAFVPGAFFWLYSRMSHPQAVSIIQWRDLSEKVLGLASVVRGYSTVLDLVTLIAAVTVVLAGAWRNPQFRVHRTWAAVSFVLFVLYWLFPSAYATGADADRRVLPFVALLAVASMRFGARAKYLVLIATVLLVTRVANTAYSFRQLQPEQEMMARSFNAIPRNARVLPIVEVLERRHILRIPHEFWSYGVIRRGWFSPYVFDDPGVHPLRIKPVYAPKGFGAFHYRENLDWGQIAAQYDYVWAYDVKRFDPELTRIGDLVFQEGLLYVYRIRREIEDQTYEQPAAMLAEH